jgi:hypothetical protein
VSETGRLILSILAGACIMAASFWITLMDLRITDSYPPPSPREQLPAEPHASKASDVSTTSGLREPYTPDRGFDGSRAPSSFWEAGGPFPVDLVVILPHPATIDAYGLSAGETGDRMPASWLLEGSLDGRNWTKLDLQVRVPPWKADESRTFRIGINDSVRQLRFHFLAGYHPTILRIYEIELGQR